MKKNKRYEADDFKMCENCILAKPLKECDLVVCSKHGLKNFDDVCRHFEINLLAITPKKLRTFSTALSEEDFKL